MQINKGQTVGGKEVAKRVWIKFDEPEVGSMTRQQIKNKLKPEGEHTDDMCKWTPIEITKLEFQFVYTFYYFKSYTFKWLLFY